VLISIETEIEFPLNGTFCGSPSHKVIITAVSFPQAGRERQPKMDVDDPASSSHEDQAGDPPPPDEEDVEQKQPSMLEDEADEKGAIVQEEVGNVSTSQVPLADLLALHGLPQFPPLASAAGDPPGLCKLKTHFILILIDCNSYIEV
jgi:hypothetical protein